MIEHTHRHQVVVSPDRGEFLELTLRIEQGETGSGHRFVDAYQHQGTPKAWVDDVQSGASTALREAGWLDAMIVLGTTNGQRPQLRRACLSAWRANALS